MKLFTFVCSRSQNKSVVLAELKAMKFQTKARRREYWNMKEMIEMQTKLRDSLTEMASEDITLT